MGANEKVDATRHDEYTPSTDETRTAWMYFNNDTENWESRTHMERAGYEFDRWLREHDAKVWGEGFDATGTWGTAEEHGRIRDSMNPYRNEEVSS